MKKKEKEELNLPEEIEFNPRAIVNNTELIREGNDITNQIISENDPSKLDELSQLFTLNQKKKQIVRTNKLSNLLDKIDDTIVYRLDSHASSIEDKDLIGYLRAAESSVRGLSDEEGVQLPKITINNTQNINVNSSGLNRESRAKVLDVVNQILKGVGEDVIDVEVKEKDR